MESRWGDFKHAAFLCFFPPSSLTCLFPCVYLLCRSLSLFFLPKNLRWKVLKTRSCLAVMHTGCDSVTHKFIPGCPVVICLPSGAEGWELTSHEKNTESFRLLRILFILFLREFKAPPRTLIFFFSEKYIYSNISDTKIINLIINLKWYLTGQIKLAW